MNSKLYNEFMLKKVREETIMKYSNQDEFDKANAFGQGKPNDAFAKYFVGNSF